MPAITVDALKAHLNRQSEKLLGLSIGKRNERSVFLTEAGELRSPNGQSTNFNDIVKEIDIPRITFHGLRHTHITYLLMSNEMDIKTISQRAGHASVSITLDIYGHVINGRDEEAAAMMDWAFGGHVGEQD